MKTSSHFEEIIEDVWTERVWDSELPDISHLNHEERQDFVRKWMNERHRGFKDELLKKVKAVR